MAQENENDVKTDATEAAPAQEANDGGAPVAETPTEGANSAS